MGPKVAIGQELGLVVNTKSAGKGRVTCVVKQPDGSEVDAVVLENEDSTFDIFYTTPAPGNYIISVRFGGENIPCSPFKVTVSDGCRDVNTQVLFHLIYAFGLQTKRLRGSGSKHLGPHSQSILRQSTFVNMGRVFVCGRDCESNHRLTLTVVSSGY